MSPAEPQPPSGSDWRTDRRAIQRRRLRKLRWLALFAFIAFLIFVAASLAAAAYTERSSYCETACHEMGSYGRSWQKSAHKDSACVKCHIKPGALEFVEAKGSALREVYVHFTGQVKAPIAVTEHIPNTCLLYTSDAADDLLCVDLGGRRIIKKKKKSKPATKRP